MTNSPLTPEPNDVPVGLDTEDDLRTGADNGPDILQGIAEDEPDLESVVKHDSVPFRTPVAGQRLTEEQLEHDIE
jgi:hypothetical protein